MVKGFEDLKEVQMIVFAIGHEEYALPIKRVQEIIVPLSFTKIPRLPDFIEGLINLRGRILPVVDGRKRFQIESDSLSNKTDGRIVIIDIQDHTVGLMVDSVSEVLTLKTADIEPPPVSMDCENTDVLWGIGKYHDRLIILLNPDEFLSHHESLGLSSITAYTQSQNVA